MSYTKSFWCPYCGDGMEPICDGPGIWYYRCKSCYSQGPLAATEEEAKEAADYRE